MSRWNLDPVLGFVLALAAVVLLAARHRGAAALSMHRPSLWWAWALTVLLYVSPLCALSSAFFTVRVVHHMALVLLIAPLLAFGLEPRSPRAPAALWTATTVASATFWLWHLPAPYEAALSSVGVYALMQLTLLGSAFAFWRAVRRAEPLAALAAILATTVLMGLLGALITFADRPLYAPHFAATFAWSVAPLQDQQLAGIVMWAPGSFAYLAAAVWIGWRWMRQDRNRHLHAAAAR